MKLHWEEAKKQLTWQSFKKTLKDYAIVWLIYAVVKTVVYLING